MARRLATNGRVIMGVIQFKRIQDLVWWVRYRQKLLHPIDADLWTAAAMTNTDISKRIKKDQPNMDMKAADLKAFQPDELCGNWHRAALRKGVFPDHISLDIEEARGWLPHQRALTQGKPVIATLDEAFVN